MSIDLARLKQLEAVIVRRVFPRLLSHGGSKNDGNDGLLRRSTREFFGRQIVERMAFALSCASAAGNQRRLRNDILQKRVCEMKLSAYYK